MEGYLVRLKSKWGIKSNLQLGLILAVFSITGSVSVWIAKPILEWTGIQSDMNPWIRIPLRIVITLPVYQIILLFVGGVFGQFRFFLNLQKKWLRLGSGSKSKIS
jgi:hypothetical protein